jgi:HSP20 family protein
MTAMAETATKVPVGTEKKTPAPANIASPFETLRREIDRLFEDFRPSAWRFPFARPSLELPRLADWQIAPAIDVAEREKEYEITAELPGMDEKDIEIRLANQSLTIKGEKKEEKQERRKDYHVSERRYGAFQRSFVVPEGVDADKIEASFSKGVLKVMLPKTAEAQKAERKITVKAA